ncbi:MAG: carbohydrate ABC transporter permease [Kineosporiaceae bacterium]
MTVTAPSAATGAPGVPAAGPPRPPAHRAPPGPRRGRRRRGLRRRLLLGAAATVVVLASVFPVYWMVTTSFLPTVDITAPTPTFHPFGGTLDHYREVFTRGAFLTSLRNSLVVTLSVVALALVLACLAAVAVARLEFRGRRPVLLAVVIVQMVPAEALVVSLFRVLDGWQLVNTILGLVLVYLVFVLPFTIYTLRGFVAGVPIELEEAAMVDGCSRLRAFLSVTFPLMAPGLVATGVFGFIQAWNEFTFALVLLNRPESQTLPLWLQSFNEGARGTDWGGVMAGSTLMAVPVIVFFLLVQSRIGDGLAAGAVKG